MTPKEDLYFEINKDSNFVRIEPKRLLFEDSETYYDNNIILTKIVLKSGNFQANYFAEFMTVDFELFKNELKMLNTNFKGTANFTSRESQLELKIKGDGLGHFEASVKACETPFIYGSAELSFNLNFDQTYINNFVTLLNEITKYFPITGDFKVKNEY